MHHFWFLHCSTSAFSFISASFAPWSTPACPHAVPSKGGSAFSHFTTKNHCVGLQQSPRICQVLWTEKPLKIKQLFLWVARVWDPFLTLRLGGTEECHLCIYIYTFKICYSQKQSVCTWHTCWEQSLVHATSQTLEDRLGSGMGVPCQGLF